MVPIPAPEYFPSLEECLNGRLLLSWEHAFRALSEEPHQPATQQFFLDPSVQNLLATPTDAFPKSSAQSKTEFERRTSAINVTPCADAPYNINEIKEDALWLSREADIDELSALRVVVEEYQSRAYLQLLGEFSEEESYSLNDAASTDASSVFGLGVLLSGTKAETIQTNFDSQESRRIRLLRLYLSARQYIWKCLVLIIQQRSVHESKQASKSHAEPFWLRDYHEIVVGKEAMGLPTTRLVLLIQALRSVLEKLFNGSGSGWLGAVGGREDLELDWGNSQIIEATQMLEVIFQHVWAADDILRAAPVLEWLDLLSQFDFFGEVIVPPHPSTDSLIFALQAMSTITSMAMLGVSNCVERLTDGSQIAITSDPDVPYIFNTDCIMKVTEVVMVGANAAYRTTGPVVLAWCVILKTIIDRVDEQNQAQTQPVDQSFPYAQKAAAPGTPKDVYDGIAETIRESQGEDIVEYLGKSAVDSCHVLQTLTSMSQRLGDTPTACVMPELGIDLRTAILELLRSSVVPIGYITEIFEAVLSTLNGGQGYWDLVDTADTEGANGPLGIFTRDPVLFQAFWKQALDRYPYESLPFLKLNRALAALCYYEDGEFVSVFNQLDNLPTFTCALPLQFANYQTIQEVENINAVQLTDDLYLFAARWREEWRTPSKGRASQDQSLVMSRRNTDLCIQEGTEGRIIYEGEPKVAYLFHSYSGLKYFGKLLETYLTASDQIDATTGEKCDKDSVEEIIGLFATFVRVTSKSSKTEESAGLVDRILEAAGSGLSRNRDILSVIFDIFGEELQRQSASIGPEVDLGILTSCVQFIHSMIPLASGRIWPLVERCGLLGNDRPSGKLALIVGNIELVSCRYNFLVSCIHLFEALVDDLALHAIERRRTSISLDRFDDIGKFSGDVPDHVMERVLLSFTRYMIETLESSCTWKFDAMDDQMQISKNITSTFDKILYYAYGIQGGSDATNASGQAVGLTSTTLVSEAQGARSIMCGLIPAAAHIVESFLSTSSGALRFRPLLRTLFAGFNPEKSIALANSRKLSTRDVEATLRFSKRLLQTSILLGRSSSQLEKQLFQTSPLIARLYASKISYRRPVLELLQALVNSAASHDEEPPSLLRHFGAQAARNFISVLADLDKPFSREPHIRSIWTFLSAVMSSRQQWFANYVLTGRTARDALKQKQTVALPPVQTLLAVALRKLMNIGDIPDQEVLMLLKFVALAQNFWPWTVYKLQEHKDFIKRLITYAGELRPVKHTRNLTTQVEACYRTRVGASVAEILAMYLFHQRHTGGDSIVSALMPNLEYYTDHAVLLPTYNSSLHGNLKRNFDTKYASATLRSFRRTGLEERESGTEYFYDLDLLHKMLHGDVAWKGAASDGFRAEIAIANVNLALVDAQIALLHGWKLLAVELSCQIAGRNDFQSLLASTAINCLVQNTQSQDSEEIFVKLTQTRADFALVLCQRLINAGSKISMMQELLTTVWETIHSLGDSLDLAFATGNASYYRLLLKILYISLRIHADGTRKSANVSTDAFALREGASTVRIVLDVLRRVVANGFHNLARAAHETPMDSIPEDIAIITGILQACLRVPGIEFCHPEIANMFIISGTARIADNLFSWSDSLAINGDPIYGQLAIQFLLELSSIPPMAEQLAVEGLLGRLSSASITKYLRSTKVSPFAESAGIQRCYNIWVRGILPLLLNLLHAVGASIAAEVALFLNQFPSLLLHSSAALDQPEFSRIGPKSTPKHITLTICLEVHSLSLIIFILNGFRDSLVGISTVPDVTWDAGAVNEGVDVWLNSRQLLRKQILPMGEKDVQLAEQKCNTSDVKAENKLEEMVVNEMIGIRNVLLGGE